MLAPTSQWHTPAPTAAPTRAPTVAGHTHAPTAYTCAPDVDEERCQMFLHCCNPSDFFRWFVPRNDCNTTCCNSTCGAATSAGRPRQVDLRHCLQSNTAADAATDAAADTAAHAPADRIADASADHH